MARIRTVKPEFWDSEDTANLSPLAALTFIGLLNLADDGGRGRSDATFLWARLHARRKGVSIAKVRGVLKELEGAGIVQFYTANGNQSFYYITGFTKHQVINKAKDSKLPPPPGVVPDEYGTSTVPLPVGREGNGNGKEGKGGEPAATPPSPAPVEDPESEPAPAVTRLAKVWNTGPGLHLSGPKAADQIQAAIDVGVDPQNIDELFHSHDRIKGLRIWEALDPLRPNQRAKNLAERRDSSGPRKIV